MFIEPVAVAPPGMLMLGIDVSAVLSEELDSVVDDGRRGRGAGGVGRVVVATEQEEQQHADAGEHHDDRRDDPGQGALLLRRLAVAAGAAVAGLAVAGLAVLRLTRLAVLRLTGLAVLRLTGLAVLARLTGLAVLRLSGLAVLTRLTGLTGLARLSGLLAVRARLTGLAVGARGLTHLISSISSSGCTRPGRPQRSDRIALRIPLGARRAGSVPTTRRPARPRESIWSRTARLTA